MEKRFWKVVCRYGHVGKNKEISVARYLETLSGEKSVDVYNIASEMPGVKMLGVASIEPIAEKIYYKGKASELDNFYLQNLFNYKTQFCNSI